MAQQIKTALVVDDSRLARIALCKLLKTRGIEAEVAGNGTEGLEYLRNATPDVVFMDYMMPDMDGFEASRRALSDPTCGRAPIVMYTSQDSDEDRLKAREIGISAFLSKPTSAAALDEVLKALASRPVSKPAVAVTAAAAPATPAAPTAKVVPARSGADPEAVRTIALEAAERVAQRFFEQLRDELAATSDSVLQQATETAERSAAAAVDAAAARLTPAQEPVDVAALEARARQAAEAAAKEVAAAAGRESGTAAARALSPELVEEARTAAAEAVEAADLRGRLQKIVQEVMPALRKDVSAAAHQAAEAAVRSGLDAQVAMLDSRLKEAAKLAAVAETKAARGGLVTVAVVAGLVAGLVAGAVAGFLF